MSEQGEVEAVPMRRLPGQAQRREDALREYEDFNRERRSRIERVLWTFLAPDPDEFYRWRVELDCGCIAEVMTHGDKQLPAEQRWLDHRHHARLPAGQMVCHHDDAPPAPYRDVAHWGTEWGDDRREMTFPAGPADPPPGHWAEDDPEMWAKVRHDEPSTSAFWRVTLSCGHVAEVVTDLEWKPSDGPHRVSAERQRELEAEWEEGLASDPETDEQEAEHWRRMVADGWPRPAPEQHCYTCPSAHRIVAYQRIGWLVPRKPKPKPPSPPSRATLERALKKAEAEASKLRERLASLEE